MPEDENLERWDVQPTGGEYYTTLRGTYRTQVDVVLPDGHAVLNADDELVADIAGLCDGEVIFFACDPASPVHGSPSGRRQARRSFVVDGRIVLRHRRRRDSPLPPGRRAGISARPRTPTNIANVLAGVAAGWALGLSQDVTGHRHQDLRPRPPRPRHRAVAARQAAATGQKTGCRPEITRNPASWTFPAFVPCAAPTCGAGTPPFRPSSPAKAPRVAIANLPGFEARLRERFPEMGDLIPADHLDTVSMAHALEFAALGLQAQAGCPVTFSRTAQTVDTGVYQVVVEYTEEDVGRLAFERAEAALPGGARTTRPSTSTAR